MVFSSSFTNVAFAESTVLDRCKIPSAESLVTRTQLRWAGYVVLMGSQRIPKPLIFGELSTGKRTQGGQRKRYKDALKASLKSYGIDPVSFERIAKDCTQSRS